MKKACVLIKTYIITFRIIQRDSGTMNMPVPGGQVDNKGLYGYVVGKSKCDRDMIDDTRRRLR